MTKIINTKSVDLHSIEIKTPEDEKTATRELVSQILGWMSNNDKQLKKVNTLIMNKLVYFSMKEIQKTNKTFLITSGWYKYGPCYEELREQEAPNNLEEYTMYQPRKQYIDEIESVCNQEFKIFEPCSTECGSTSQKEQYYYTYLKHVYTNGVPSEYKWIQEFYQSKHELENLMYRLAFHAYDGDNVVMQQQFSDHLFQFESAICNEEYDNNVKLSNLKDTTLNFSTVLEPIFIDYLLSSKPESVALNSLAQEVAKFFDDTLLTAFAYKNLAATFESPFENRVSYKKPIFSKSADKLSDDIRLQLPRIIKKLKSENLM